MAREYNDAIAESRRILELHPETRLAYSVIGHCYAKKGMYQEAAFREYQPKIPPSASPWIAYVFALEGKKNDAQAVIIKVSKSRNGFPFAQCYAALGENRRALDELEQAFSEHATMLAWARVTPEFDSLREEPRFVALLQKIGFAL